MNNKVCNKQNTVIIICVLISFLAGFFVHKTMGTEDYFSKMRVTRETETKTNLEDLKKIMDDDKAPATEREKAGSDYRKFITMREAESTLEQKIKALKYKECLCYIEDAKVKVIIKGDKELDDNQKKEIKDSVLSQTKIKDVEIICKVK